MVVTPLQSFSVIYLSPVLLIGMAVILRQIQELSRYFDLVVVALALGLGVWGGFIGTGTYSLLWIPCFLFNPLVVGLISTRHPIAFGLLASLAVIASGSSFLYWVVAHSGVRVDAKIADYGGVGYLVCLPFIAMVLSLIPTVPIAFYRRYRAKTARG